MTLTASIVGVNGDRFRLDREPYVLAPDHGLLTIPPVELSSLESGGLSSGDIALEAWHTAKAQRCTIWVTGTDGPNLRANMKTLAAALNPTGQRRGGTSRIVVNEGGDVRVLAGRYESGFASVDVEYEKDEIVPIDLVFRCSDPYWYSVQAEEVEQNFPITGTGFTFTDFDDATVAWSDAGTPWNGYTPTAEDGLITLNMVNTGTVPTFVRWEIEGTFSAVEFAHLGSGLVWSYTGAVATGETLIVETDERHRSARVDGANLWSNMVKKQLFPLLPGSNRIAVQVTGNDTDTRLRAIYKHRNQ